MGGVEAHSTFLLDELFDPHRGPQTRGVSQGLRPTLQSALDAPQVRWTQTGLAPRATRLLQPGATRLGQLSGPPTYRLAMDADFPRYLRLAPPFLEQSHRLQASPPSSDAFPKHQNLASHPSDFPCPQVYRMSLYYASLNRVFSVPVAETCCGVMSDAVFIESFPSLVRFLSLGSFGPLFR
jgi:hypothetical protein